MTRSNVLPVSLALINWNSAAFIPDLCKGLLQQTCKPIERLVIDNGSTDNSLELLEQLYPGWGKITLGYNTGFAHAANKAIEFSSQPFIFLLNTDVFLAADYLEILYDYLHEKSFLGGVMGLLINPINKTVDSMGIRLSSLKRRPLDINSGFTLNRIIDIFTPKTIFGINAAAALFRREIFDAIEYEGEWFDEKFISYFEDVDFSWQAKKLSWTFQCIPSAKAEHVRGGSAGLKVASIATKAYSNRFRLYLKNETFLSFLKLLPYNLSIEFYRILFKPIFDNFLRESINIIISSLPEIMSLRKIMKKRCYGNISPAALQNMHRSNSLDTNFSKIGITIIIINYETRELLRRCLFKLTKSDFENITIVIVDNASKDGSVQMVKKDFPSVHCIAKSMNKGFGNAVNSALKAFPNDYYLILNSDTEVSADFPNKLAAFMEKFPLIGISSPLIRNFDASIQISWGNYPTLFNEFFQKTLHKTYNETNSFVENEYKKILSVDWVTGACLMIKNKTIQQIGLMDENFNLYFEDIDWCKRAKLAGWEIVFCPFFEIKHAGGASASVAPQKAAYEYRQSQKYFYEKHFSFWQQIGLKLYFKILGNKLIDKKKFK